VSGGTGLAPGGNHRDKGSIRAGRVISEVSAPRASAEALPPERRTVSNLQDALDLALEEMEPPNRVRGRPGGTRQGAGNSKRAIRRARACRGDRPPTAGAVDGAEAQALPERRPDADAG